MSVERSSGLLASSEEAILRPRLLMRRSGRNDWAKNNIDYESRKLKKRMGWPLTILGNLLEKTAVYRIGYRQIFENASKLLSLREIYARDGRLALCGCPSSNR